MNSYTPSVRNQICPNKYCRFHELTLEGNIVVHGQKYPRFKCKACSKTWVIHRRESHYGLRKNPQNVISALKFLKEGLSIRKVAELVGVTPGTIHRWKTKFKNIL